MKAKLAYYESLSILEKQIKTPWHLRQLDSHQCPNGKQNCSCCINSSKTNGTTCYGSEFNQLETTPWVCRLIQQPTTVCTTPQHRISRGFASVSTAATKLRWRKLRGQGQQAWMFIRGQSYQQGMQTPFFTNKDSTALTNKENTSHSSQGSSSNKNMGTHKHTKDMAHKSSPTPTPQSTGRIGATAGCLVGPFACDLGICRAKRFLGLITHI